MKLFRCLGLTIVLLAFAGLVLAGAPGQASVVEEEDLALVKNGGDNCVKNATCLKLNRFALASNLLVRQLLVQHGVAVRSIP